MAQELGTGYVTIMPSTRGLQGEIQKSLGDAFDGALSKGEGRFKAFFGKVAAAGAAVLAAVGLGKVVKSTIQAGVQFNALEQSSRAAFTTILGSGAAATAMMEKLDAFSQTSPFDKATFIQGTQQLLGFGVAADRVIPTLQAVQDAVAAIGGSSDDISQITYALAQIKGQGKLTGETLNQLGQYGIDAASIIGQSMGKTSAQIRDMASNPGGIPADQVFDVLVDGLESKFAGAAANVKGTWSGVVQAIGARIRNIGSDLVEPFVSKEGGGYAVVWASQLADALSAIRATSGFKGLTVDLGAFAAKLSPLIDGALTKFTDLLNDPTSSTLFSTIIPQALAVARVFSPLTYIFGILKSILPTLQAPVKAIGRALNDAFVVLGPVITQTLSTFAVLMEDLAPTITQVASILALVLESALTALLPPLLSLVSSLLPVLVPLFEDLLRAVTPLLPVILTLATNGFQFLAGVLQIVADVASTVLVPALTAIGSFAADNMGVILALVGAYVAFKGVMAGIAFGKLIAGLATSTVEWVKNTAAMIASKAETIALAALYAKDMVFAIGSTIARLAVATAAWVANTAAKVANGAVDLASGLKTVAILAGMVAAEVVASTAAWIVNTATTVAAGAAQLAVKVATLAGAAAIGIATAAQWAWNVAMDANPIGLIILGIAALIAIIVLVVANWQTIVDFLYNVWNAVITWTIGVLNGFFSFWVGIWNSVSGFFVGIWNGIVSFITFYINTVFAVIQAVGSTIAGVWNAIWSGIVSFFVGAWNNIMSVVNTVGAAFGNAFSAVSGIVSGAFNGIVGVIKGAINSVIDLVNGAIGAINDTVGAAGAAFGIDLKIGKIPRLANSGTVLPRPGGTLVVAAEAGRAESIVDTGKLNDLMDAARSHGRASADKEGNTFNIYEATSGQATALEVARRQSLLGA